MKAPTLIERGVNMASSFLHIILLTLLAIADRIEEIHMSSIKQTSSCFFIL